MKVSESKFGKTLFDECDDNTITLDEIGEMYPESLKLDGFDNCIIGVDTDGRLIYSMGRMVKTLIERDGMEEEDAYDFISYNTLRALPYAGASAPIVLDYIVESD